MEILSPAGNFECLVSAIEAGADAVYLGGKLFGARAFSNNFNEEEIIKAISYAHLYGVKVYVTVNTLIYEHEVDNFLNYIDFLYKNNVDALIIQDIGMMDLIRKTYPTLELHASTQMHIHNIEGVKLVESLGLKRAVLARETDIDTIKYIKENTNIELEIFVQGALCISYSGQCLMSSLIGSRSANRGTCAGSCRQKYSLVKDSKQITKEEYLLSTKDLCSVEQIGKLIDIGVDSFKIEGRMKSPEYVYITTKIYRQAVDSYIKNKKVNIDDNLINDLKKIFNRGFTKGFLNNTKNNEITNSYRPNHQGIKIGKVIKCQNNYITIKLIEDVNINDGIRIGDVGFIITNMFKDKKKITHANKFDIISIYYKEKVLENLDVLKTTDYLLNKQIDSDIKSNKRKVLINGILEVYKDKPIKLEINDNINKVVVFGNTVDKSINNPISFKRIEEQINKLGNTIYKFDNIKIIGDEDIFISIKELNELRRKAIDLLNEKRLYKYTYIKEEYKITLPDFNKENNYNVLVNNKNQYEKIKDYNFKTIYCEEKINDSRFILKLDRVINNYKEYNNHLLVGELGSINKYKNISTDFSLNVTNSYSVAFLHSIGVNKITLSYELTKIQIENIINSYIKRYNKRPNLELIVYAKEEAMISKFNLNKLYAVDNTYLNDRFNNLYPIVIKNDLMRIYNYKPRFISDYNDYFKIGVNNIRFNILDNKDLDNVLNIIKDIYYLCQ
jgi:putative protease